MNAPKQGIQLKQTQTLAVTPQMTQRLHILQCNQQQLQTEIQQMLDKNIMLSRIDDSMDFELGDDDFADEFDTNSDSLVDEIPEQLDVDADWDNVYDDYRETFDDRPKKIDDVDGFQEDWVADSASFDECLLQAIYLSPLSDEDKQLALKVLQHLNDDYFLDQPVAQLAKTLNADVDKLQSVVNCIRYLDPPGVASQNIQECLLAQLLSLGNNGEAAVNAYEILNDYYDYIDKKPDFIRRRLALSQAEYDTAMQLIRTLSPYPKPPDESTHQLILPDVFVRQRMGMFFASANHDARYDLAINEDYAELSKACKGDEKSFMKAQLQEAKFFLSALDQRQKTVVRVANAIVMHQQDYFLQGDTAMRPLQMKVVADMLGLNESTISRAVNGKYLSFKKNLIELRYFFSQNLSRQNSTPDDDVAASATAAKAHIKAIIADESPKKPLSDSKIEQLLKTQGIDISRRTVAKYRESLGIPKTSERKCLK